MCGKSLTNFLCVPEKIASPPFIQKYTTPENMCLSPLRENANANQVALKFPSFIFGIGEGTLQDSYSSFTSLQSFTFIENDVKKLIDFVLPDLKNNHLAEIWLPERVVLTTRTMNLEGLNNFVRDLIPGDAKRFSSADKIDNEEEHELQNPLELLTGISGTVSLSDHQILLKERYLVILLRNLQPKNVHMNRENISFSL